MGLFSHARPYNEENLFFKDDDTHVFIETKNSVAIIKSINVFKDKLRFVFTPTSIHWKMIFSQTNLFWV
jgi:hypothetical protein